MEHLTCRIKIDCQAYVKFCLFIGINMQLFMILISQILQAKSNEELKDLANTDECGELLEHSGCTAILNVSFSYYYVVVY